MCRDRFYDPSVFSGDVDGDFDGRKVRVNAPHLRQEELEDKNIFAVEDAKVDDDDSTSELVQ